MKERPLPHHVNTDETPVSIDDDTRAAAMKEATELSFAASTLHNYLKDGTLDVGFSQTLLSLLESYTVHLHKLFQYESTLQAEHEKRHQEIRSLHAENRELRRQLGEKVNSEDVREHLKILHEHIRDWWKAEGLGYVKEVAFQEYGCKVTISGSMSIHYDEGQPTKLTGKGYLLDEREHRDFDLVLSDQNVDVLMREIKQRFPSATISTINTTCYRNTRHIRECEFMIRDLTDIVPEALRGLEGGGE